ncbi:MAG: Ig-like domain-containing protein, partial [Verrucomicrobiota bacterium]
GNQTVRCRVSDRHGGVTTLTYEVQVQFNKPPAIQVPASVTTAEDAPLNVDFTVSDPTLDPSAIVTSVVSGNPVVVPAGRVFITSQGGGQRRLTITPAPNQHGLVPLYLTASDGQEQVVQRVDLTVRPVTPGPVLVAGNGAWRYWDLPDAPEAGWAQPGFGEAGWATGIARFVHQQGLLLPPGWTRLRDAPGRVSTYFRRVFPVPAGFSGTLTLKLVCDDGAVIHVNGQEAARHNLPAGGITPATRALRSIEGSEESKAVLLLLDASLLQPGTNNLLAVEVHDVGGLTGRGGGDVAFDAELALLQAPALGRIGNVLFSEDTVLGPVRLTVADAESPSGPLTLTARSSNPAVIPDGGIAVTRHPFTGWQYTLVPLAHATGTAEITVEASDGSSLARRSFTATVTPVNDAPVVDPLPPVVTALGRLPGLVRVRVRDVDHDPAALQVTAKSSLAALVPASGITVLPGGSPDERFLRLLPTPGVAAETTITVQASDGVLAGSASFLFRVSPAVSPAMVPLPLVESGAAWRYWVDALPLDSRGNPVDWTRLEVADREWPSGPGPLGYGGQGEKTGVPSLPLRVTTYFRRSFLVADTSQLAGLRLRLRRDDGAVVYLNGVRVLASNMPRGVITATTPASSDLSGAAGLAWVEADLDPTALVSGRNLLAVEVHQSALPTLLARGDLAFDLELDGLPAATGTEDVLVPQRARWAYWDSPEYPGELWSDGSYPAADWPQGLARLGFGLADLGTTVGAGMAGARPPAVLLRHVFPVPDP